MALLALALLQEHSAPQGGEAAHVATPFDINTGLIFWTLIVFGILLVLLWRFAWPTIVKTVEEREKRIAKQLADAEQANAQAQKLLEEHKAAIAKARGEAQDIIAKANTVAQKERDILLAKAHEEQEQILERARREIGAERDKAIMALRREAVELSIAAASKLVEANLDTEANRKLVTEYLAGLEGKA